MPKKKSSADKLSIAIANDQTAHPVPARLLRRAAREVLRGEGVREATISLAIVDDPTIHRLNRKHLQHDYPTDVLSFLLDSSPDGEMLDGEIIVSADTAAANADQYQTTLSAELTLYVIHGLLHLVGYDDHSAADCRTMRRKEEEYLAKSGGPDQGRKRAPRRKPPSGRGEKK